MSAELFQHRRFEGMGFYALGIIFALTIHGGVSVGAVSMQKNKKKQTRVEMAVIKKAKPPPPPKPEPPPPKPEKPKPKPRVPKDVVKPPDLPPPSNQPPPTDKPQKPVPIVTGISLDSTVSSGVGMSVRVGNTLYGDIDKEKFVKAEDVKPYAGPVYKPVKTHEITEEPSVLKEVKAEMPETAKRAGIQGTIVLKVEVTKAGTVRKVKVVKGLGYGLDEAAVAAMKKFRFRPAKKGGKPVDYTISRFYYVFELVD